MKMQMADLFLQAHAGNLKIWTILQKSFYPIIPLPLSMNNSSGSMDFLSWSVRSMSRAPFRKKTAESSVLPSGSKPEIIHGSDLRSEENTSELQSRGHLVCRLLLEKK